MSMPLHNDSTDYPAGRTSRRRRSGRWGEGLGSMRRSRRARRRSISRRRSRSGEDKGENEEEEEKEER